MSAPSPLLSEARTTSGAFDRALTRVGRHGQVVFSDVMRDVTEGVARVAQPEPAGSFASERGEQHDAACWNMLSK